MREFDASNLDEPGTAEFDALELVSKIAPNLSPGERNQAIRTAFEYLSDAEEMGACCMKGKCGGAFGVLVTVPLSLPGT